METLQDIVGIKFNWYDYSFFILTLLASGFIGVYYGIYNKQETVKDYLFGGKSLMFIPVALSVISTNLSGVVLLAVPSDIYRYGISYWFTYFAVVLAIFVSHWIFFPVFWKLQVTSIFEYLKLRFDSRVRLLGSSLYLAYSIFLQPVFIYIPSLALAQATGLNVYLISCIVCFICIFYTSVGGLKAVVYADVLQSVAMILSLIITFALGVYKCGGFANVWATSNQNERLLVTFEWDFTKRNAIWATTIGSFTTWLCFMGLNQIYIQKYLSLPCYSDINKVLILSAVGIFATASLANFLGLVIYTEYSNCDPFEAGILQRLDELVPYYVMQLSKLLPGLAGLFVAGIVSASLSTLSSYLNSLPANIFKDYIADYLPKTTSQRRIGVLLKLITVAIGLACTGLVVLVEQFGALLILGYSGVSVVAGSLLGLFVSGMLIPTFNSKGAYYGAIASTLITGFIAFGTVWYQMNGHITIPPLPVSTKGCLNLNVTSSDKEDLTDKYSSDDVPYIFRITFYWYTPIGLIAYLVVGGVISIFTKTEKFVERELFAPLIHPFLATKGGKSSMDREQPNYRTIEDSLNMTTSNKS